MSSLYKIGSLKTESDVEQNLLMPLLRTPRPLGLGFAAANVRTKPDIRSLVIGKGSDQKLYFPDYVVVVSGLPVMVLEAKSPSEGVEDGYREARLYAAELNAQFPASVNPVSIVVCCNGERLVAGSWDSDQPRYDLDSGQLDASVGSFAELLEYAGAGQAAVRAKSILETMTSRPFCRPTQILGGQAVRNEEIGHNAFGATLSLDYRHLFNPSTDEERAYIVKHAYVCLLRGSGISIPLLSIQIPKERRHHWVGNPGNWVRRSETPNHHTSPFRAPCVVDLACRSG